MLEWVAIPFSRGSSWVSWIEGRFFTVWTTWEAQEQKTHSWLLPKGPTSIHPHIGVEVSSFEFGRSINFKWGFSAVSDDKESACGAGDMGLICGSGRSPGEGNGYPFQNILAWRIHGQRSLAGYSPWGHKVRHDWGDLADINRKFSDFISLQLICYSIWVFYF